MRVYVAGRFADAERLENLAKSLTDDHGCTITHNYFKKACRDAGRLIFVISLRGGANRSACSHQHAKVVHTRVVHTVEQASHRGKATSLTKQPLVLFVVFYHVLQRLACRQLHSQVAMLGIYGFGHGWNTTSRKTAGSTERTVVKHTVQCAESAMLGCWVAVDRLDDVQHRADAVTT